MGAAATPATASGPAARPAALVLAVLLCCVPGALWLAAHPQQLHSCDGAAARTRAAAPASASAGSPGDTAGGVRLFVGVISAAANTARRAAVRATWGADARLARLVFVVNRPINRAVLDALRAEALASRDVLLVGHVMEHYHNLSHQTLEVFRAAYTFGAEPHGRISHVLKCDDDSFVHVGRLLAFLAAQQLPANTSLHAGHLNPDFPPDRNPASKTFVSREEWPEERAELQWANGPGYVLSADLAFALATGGAVACMPGPLFKLEDIAVAAWLRCLERERSARIARVSDNRFNFLACAPGDLVSHYRSPEQMACMHRSNGSCC